MVAKPKKSFLKVGKVRKWAGLEGREKDDTKTSIAIYHKQVSY